MPLKKLTAREQTLKGLVTSIHKETRAAMLFVQTISEITGIHATDIKCLDYLSEVRCATAGDLSKITGLTTGAITAVIDRLEKAGFVRREADAKDRRKILIRLIAGNPHNLALVRDLFEKQIPNLLSGYKTEELALIEAWNLKLATVFHSEIGKLQTLKGKHRSP